MHSCSHREPKKSIYKPVRGASSTLSMGDGQTNLWLQQQALEQHEDLMPEVVDEGS